MVRDEDLAGTGLNGSDHRTNNRRLNDRRLDSWKEIGAFFGRDERTVKRWEAGRGLPVHRVPGRGRATVYAYASELESWLKSADATIAGTSGETAHEAAPVSDSTFDAPLAPDFASSADATTAPPDSGFAPEPGPTPEVGALEEKRSGAARPIAEPQPKSRVWIYLVASTFLAFTVAGILLAAFGFRIHPPSKLPAGRGRKHEPTPEAQEFFLKGEFYLQKRTPESLNQAVDFYTQAIVHDPAYAEAYAGLADCYNLLREYTLMPSSEAYPRALAAAKQAIALDDSLAGAHSALAFVDFYWLWDVPGAEREFKRALQLDPSSISAHHWYATFLLHLGRSQQALAEIDAAQRLDPSSRSILADKGLILSEAGHLEEATTLLQQMQAAEPTFLSPRNYLAIIYFGTGNYQGYLAESAEAARLVQNLDRLSIVEAGEKGLKSNGPEGMFRGMLARQTELYAAGRFSAFGLAETYAMLGEKQEALSYLRIAWTRREPEIAAIRIGPALRSLHNAPEYRKILAEAGFPPIPDQGSITGQIGTNDRFRVNSCVGWRQNADSGSARRARSA
jgi:tetratricopeptide (TPR) repeat protein